MSHSHLSVKHLLAQIETNRSQRTKRDIRPDWLNALIEAAAESFEPLVGVGRVGFDCQPQEGGWAVSLYLGAVEMVGGKEDGHTTHPDFRCDLKAVLERFSRIDSVEWTVYPQGLPQGEPKQRSIVSMVGLVGTSPVSLQVHSAAPDALNPGLRQFPDGRVETV